jgi:hypothetical protein
LDCIWFIDIVVYILMLEKAKYIIDVLDVQMFINDTKCVK